MLLPVEEPLVPEVPLVPVDDPVLSEDDPVVPVEEPDRPLCDDEELDPLEPEVERSVDEPELVPDPEPDPL